MMHLDAVTRHFGPTVVLDGISLSVPDGSFTSLLGPSGCGKSTTLRIIAGLDRAHTGSVVMDGRDVSAWTAAERNVAMVFQSYALYPHLTVAQNIGLPLAMRRMRRFERLPWLDRLLPSARRKRSEIDRDVTAMADLLGLSPLLGRKPAHLSGGQQQRVAVGRALIREPSVFLLDEPLSNLDARLRIQMRDELRALHRRTGRSFVYVTHDQAEAIGMSDQVALMLDGRIAQVGPPRSLYETPASRAVAAFLGDHPINLVPVAFSGRRLDGAFSGYGVSGAAVPPRAILGIRPEHLTVDPAGSIVGRVDGVEYLGATTAISLRTEDGGRLRSVVGGDTDIPEPGAALRLRFNPRDGHLFDCDDGARLPGRLEAVP